MAPNPPTPMNGCLHGTRYGRYCTHCKRVIRAPQAAMDLHHYSQAPADHRETAGCARCARAKAIIETDERNRTNRILVQVATLYSRQEATFAELILAVDQAARYYSIEQMMRYTQLDRNTIRDAIKGQTSLPYISSGITTPTNRETMKHTTMIPFGMSAAGELRADTEDETFTLELRDVNGAPILTLVQDIVAHEPYYRVTLFGVMVDNEATAGYIGERNRRAVQNQLEAS